MLEEGTVVLDQATGIGTFHVFAVFTGTVAGSEPGTAIMRIDGTTSDFGYSVGGHWNMERGEGGLAGLHAEGQFSFPSPVDAGSYTGQYHFE